MVQKFSDLFATKFNCDQLKDSDETEYFKCLVEKGMMFASILYAKQMAYDKDKDIEFLCDLLISETTEAKGLYTFYSRLQRCLAKIQIKIFTRNYTLNKSEKLLLELMRQVPVVKTLHGEESKDFDNLIIAIYNTVDLLENNKR